MGNNGLMSLAKNFAVTLLQADSRPAVYEYVLVGIAVVVTAWVIVRAIRVTLRPGEEQKDHIKRVVLEDDGKQRHE